MSRRIYRSVSAVTVLIAGLLSLTIALSRPQSATQPSTKNGDWPYYTADVKGSKYSPLDQVNGSNFKDLEVAWRFKTDNLGTRPEYKLEGTPLVIKGIMYATGGTRRAVFALRADTGELLWTHSEFEGARAVNSPRQLSGRGVSYWTDGKEERILYVTTGYRLIALDAKTGNRITNFGKDGVVDLKAGLVSGTGQQIDLESGDAGLHSTPTVVKDVVIVGIAMKEGMTVKTHNNTKGQVRAFDVKSGKLLWAFNTIPKPGEFGNDTWLNNSWATNGNTGVWTQITVDEDAGLVYLPVETPTSDYYGGHRPGNNLFGESLVAVDLKTGQRKWYYQIVHHPIWNFDNSSAPMLADINVNGRAIKAVALPHKIGWLYVFDRVTGQPVWPIEERPVEQSDVPGEKTSPTQPFPTKPPAYSRQFLKVPDDVIDFTPALREEALQLIEKYKVGTSPFTPPILGNVNGPLGAIGAGTATNWPGSAYDPETHTVFAQASNLVSARSLTAPPSDFSDIRYVEGIGGQQFQVVLGPGDCCAADAGRTQRPENATPPPAANTRAEPPPARAAAGLNIQGLPIVKPPYGTLAAINLDRGEIVWRVAHGDTPDVVRNHPALKGIDIPKTGQPGTSGVGLMVTKTLVVMGDSQITAPPGRPRGAMLRAYDKKTGEQVGALWMPAQQSGSPMTYMVDGKQYIVVAASGGPYSGEFLAFKLPE